MGKLLQNILSYGFGAAMLASSASAFADDTFDLLGQYETVEAMGSGWNLGNTLEANSNGTPNETVFHTF